MLEKQRLVFLRLSLGWFALLLAGSTKSSIDYLTALDVQFSLALKSWWLVLGLSAISAVLVLLFLLSWTGWHHVLLDRATQFVELILHSKMIAGILLALGVFAYPWVIFTSFGINLSPLAPRFLFYSLMVLAMSLGIKSFWPSRSFWLTLAGSALWVGFLHQVGALFNEVSTLPFSLGWSETSRFYYASLFFSEQIYGFQVPPSVLHPTRYLMQSVPFLIPGLPLWVHRLWQAFLWLSITLFTAGLLIRRLRIQDRQRKWMFVIWVFLYLLVGPIYYHLQVIALIVLAGFNHKKLLRSTIFVLLASVWAGVSRVNWYPMPAMIAAALYFLEQPLELETLPTSRKWKHLLHYFSWPLLWGIVGTLTAFSAQALYVVWSGNDPGQFTSSFTSDLLWYRLWPNATYPLGILPSVLLFSAPFLVLMFVEWRQGRDWSHQLRWLALFVILMILFAGGLVVSVKIGGGSNLHNMDAYLMLLLVICAYLYASRFAWETGSPLNPARISPWLTAIILLIPIVYLVPAGGPKILPDQNYVETTQRELDQLVSETVAAGGEVLFVTQRQLVTFGTIPNVTLIPDYEVVFLMEMAMGNNQAYLEQFYADLQSQRFDLIITDWLPQNPKKPGESFSEEHNAWYFRVASPIQQEYAQMKLYKALGIEVGMPRK